MGAMSKKKQPSFRSPLLAEALEHQDMAAVAFALRNDRVVVPLISAGATDKPTDAGEVWTYKQPETGRLARKVAARRRDGGKGAGA